MAIKDVKNQGSKAPASKVRSWVEAFMNPLAGMTKRSIERMLEQKRLGNDAMLQVAYAEVEANMPIFGITIDKRVAGVAGRAWDVVPVDESAAAKAQAEKVKAMFEKADMKNKDGLGRALEHLVLGAFRGRSCVKCFVDGEDLSFKALDNWNVLEKNGRLYWNPDLDVDMDVERLQEIPDGEVAWTSYARPVDQPGIMIYLRQLVGEEQWARFVEKQGIPQVILTPPEGTSDSQQDEWMYRAMRIFEGGSGVIPPGGQVTELTAGRGQDPFTDYVRHQMETISILATGGTLLTLGGSTGLNSNLADVQLAQFETLVNRDCKQIQNALNGSAVPQICRKALGQPQLCRFQFVEKDSTTPAEYLELAQKCRDLGLAVDAQKLREMTRLQFISEDTGVAWTPGEDPQEESAR